ncbi:tRNA (adenosine(37)-N6)-threonylcarbamoyltransferase complex transferase subunit TsaD [Candidatus Sumerlaeota bacterium]|nr:tRNA (adenosine(37)-N6)-threonylcarbamoyltransferase complex transferase subunit TsaD [Candidatus Sumerlaeota bacterium]
MLILGIESSCDETAAAVVEDGRRVLSNNIASQVPIHQRYGGVVPEIASRAHLEQIVQIVEGALSGARVALSDINAIAVTRGPGLIGCLLVGVEFAKGLAAARGIPLLSVQHIAGHLYSPFIGREHDAWGVPVTDRAPAFEPYIGLAVSGGHSSMALVRGPLAYEPLGETLDDAVGEAYDKIAKHIGLGYPGGPIVDRLAAQGNPRAFAFPRPLLNRDDLDFSFSGLKSSFAREVEKLGGPDAIQGNGKVIADLCASFQAACIDVMVGKCARALKQHRLSRLAVVGGVACNRGLRAALATRMKNIAVALPEPEFCTDNAAMIAGVGHHVHASGAHSDATMNAKVGLELTASAKGWQQAAPTPGAGAS